MKKSNNFFRGSVLIYALFLVNLALIMGVVVFNLAGRLFVDDYYYSLQSTFNKHIKEKAEITFSYTKFLNSNGSGYIDAISCPSNVTMSGVTMLSVISTSLSYSSGSIFCEGVYNSNPVYIYYNTGFTDFTGATYISTVGLTGGVGNSTFSDGDVTLISFSTAGLGGVDGIDDDFNDDDYRASSSGVVYPDGFEDDDVDARKNIYGYISSGEESNIFWNYQKNMDYIASNTNNSGTTLIGTSSGNIYLDIDSDFELKVVAFDRNTFNNEKSLKIVSSLTASGSGGVSGYIQSDGSVSALGPIKTGNEYLFDFTGNDYALFLTNSSTGTLFFQMKGYTATGSGIIINPIDDSNLIYMSYLGGDILTSDEGYYLYDEREIVRSK